MKQAARSAAIARAPTAADRIRSGDVRAIARCISLIENGDPAAAAIVDALQPHAGKASVIGVTGVPGAGKSTLVSALALKVKESGARPALLAVDPSSSITGGAILGDRIRDSSETREIFFRSVATRGNAGGLSRTLDEVVTLLDAAGRSPILVETVGTGQSEIDITRLAHTTLAVTTAGLGDEIQAMKSGINEVADLHVVNKADVDPRAAQKSAMVLRHRLADGTRSAGLKEGANPPTDARPAAWLAPVRTASARTSEGLEELLRQIAAHREFLEANGGVGRWLRLRARTRFRAALRDALYAGVFSHWGEHVGACEGAVERGELGPAGAAERLASEVLTMRGIEGRIRED